MYMNDAYEMSGEIKNTDSSSITFDAMGDGIDFKSRHFDEETEITGPMALKLFVSSSTEDADLFVVLRLFSDQDNEVVFQGAVDPYTPIAQGWLRASHRKLDQQLSRPWRPYHSHTEKAVLNPGEIVEMDIEIWPTSIVIPKGYYLMLSIQGKDYECPDAQPQKLSNFKNQLKGCGPFLHNDPIDRDARFNGQTSLHFGESRAPYLLLPIIPKQ